MPSTNDIHEDLPQEEAPESATIWLKREAAVGFEQLDRGEYMEMDRDTFMNHFRIRRQVV